MTIYVDNTIPFNKFSMNTIFVAMNASFFISFCHLLWNYYYFPLSKYSEVIKLDVECSHLRKGMLFVNVYHFRRSRPSQDVILVQGDLGRL